MALTFAERESITNDYFMADGGKATDIYFNDSFLLNYLLKQKKGLWERPEGGEHIRVPLEYAEQTSGFYSRGATVDSTDVESLNAARFDWKHAYGNATVYRIDELKNSGVYAEVQMTVQRVAGAQKTITKLLCGSIYDDHGGASTRLTGLLACCSETTGTAYGNIAEDDMSVWEGITTTTTEAISLPVLRNMVSAAKVRDGKGGKPNLIVTTETLYNTVSDLLQVQQRFTDGKETAKAGFTGIIFEGKELFPDDYCPSGYAFALNTNYLGFAVHKKGYFVRDPWRHIPDSPGDKTMKIFFDGNMICSNRKAQIAHSNLS